MMLKQHLTVLAEIDTLVGDLGALPDAPLAMPRQRLEPALIDRRAPALPPVAPQATPGAET
ncbi:hypothetical protein [Phaeovulum vinaykumarii]|uniref:Uncharacterized protein n=1 Tax=Phaeovulum vinaykumarii TaxID=407234 RepID=A0A1N7M1N8_9RHOB|nr:hypothetical protein [Phaeovulum vinaykumarii]SIS79973.1 hypothetical protein SAMN05421795_10563 [Phaeovulum vinaykumarii]SOC09466.1 hypothetical protein SAMN05878426_105139 [Phaeovulum vinaykumarii]